MTRPAVAGLIAALTVGLTSLVPTSASAVTPGVPEPGLTGSWLGYVTCTDAAAARRRAAPRAIPALLDVRDDGGLTADLYVIEMYAPAVRMTGSYDAQARRLALRATEWIYKSRTVTAAPAITATMDASGLRLEGDIALRPGLAQCATWRAFKFARDRRPDNPQGLLAAFPDARQAARAPDAALCTRVLTWAADGSMVEAQGESIPSQLVDGDSFYEVVGKPYDRWTDADQRIVQAFLGGCRAALRQSARIADTDLAAKQSQARQIALFLNPGAPERPSESRHFMYLTRYAAVVAARTARRHAESAVADARASQATPADRERIAATANALTRGSGIFGALDRAAAARYAALLDEQQQRIVGALDKDARAVAEREVSRLEAIPADDPSALPRIEAVAKTLEPTLARLAGGRDAPYRRRIAQKREGTLTTLIGARLASLDGHPPGKAGLAQSAQWAADVRADFGAYESTDAFRRAMARFREARNRLLRASLPEFEAAVKRNGADVAALRRQYLSWEGDAGLASALQYDAAALGAGR